MIKDIDAVLKARLDGIMVTVPAGQAAAPVLIKNPEEEFKDVSFPSIAVSLFDIRYQSRRQNWEPTLRNETQDTIGVFKPSIPYDLYYQVMSLATFQLNDRELNQGIMTKLPAPQSYITVNGHKLSVVYDGFVVADSVGADGKRVFKKVSTFIVETELDDTDFTTYYKVKTVELTVHPGLTEQGG